MRDTILALIDFFYPPFRKVMPLHTFRYALCGGGNMALDIFLFFIFYNFVFQKQILQLGFFAFQPHTAAFLGAFCITFPIGFLLSKYIVWTTSVVKGHVQLFRYFVIVILNLLFNLFFIKLLVEYFHFYPTIAKIVTTTISVLFSYLSHKHFTFKVKKQATPTPKDGLS
jgi:putative flippase GtrA